MRPTWLFKFLAGGCLLITMAFVQTPSASAVPITLDQFAFPNPATNFVTFDAGVSDVTDIDASILGGRRRMIVAGGSANFFDNVNLTRGTSPIFPFNKALDFNNSGDGVPTMRLIYGILAGGVALGDLTGGGGNTHISIPFDFRTDGDPGLTPMNLEILVDSLAGPDRSILILVQESALPFVIDAFFAAFAGGVGNAGFTDVQTLEFRFNFATLGNPSRRDLDFRINGDQGIILQNGDEIPEPTSMALFGIAGLGLWVSRRRKKVAT